MHPLTHPVQKTLRMILHSRKFSDGNIFGQSRISTFRMDFIFVPVLHAKCTCSHAVRTYSVHSFTGTKFKSTEFILVQKRPCTKSYENKFRPKISCYTVTDQKCNMFLPPTSVVVLYLFYHMSHDCCHGSGQSLICMRAGNKSVQRPSVVRDNPESDTGRVKSTGFEHGDCVQRSVHVNACSKVAISAFLFLSFQVLLHTRSTFSFSFDSFRDGPSSRFAVEEPQQQQKRSEELLQRQLQQQQRWFKLMEQQLQQQQRWFKLMEQQLQQQQRWFKLMEQQLQKQRLEQQQQQQLQQQQRWFKLMEQQLQKQRLEQQQQQVEQEQQQQVEQQQ
ncbi:uncharacterized protein LOC135826404 [Sycon ciliatum]|uniref:uncharacterized protein LOC135826404 n=1 Tax=Sycon ciliatum TaxID=27933 RepID=UPI0031F6AD36